MENGKQEGVTIDNFINNAYGMTTGLNNFIASVRDALIKQGEEVEKLKKEIEELKSKKSK